MDLADQVRIDGFRDRTVAITGALGVIGGELAAALVSCGANVVLLDRNVEGAGALIERLGPPAHPRVLVVVTDVTDRASLERSLETAVGRFGAVDALVNGAGGNRPDATVDPGQRFFDLPAEAMRAVCDLNLMGTVLPCQVYGRAMADRGEGTILNISSMTAFRPLTRVVMYSAAKAAVTNFTQWLAVHMAQEYSPRIRVNAIAPGFLLTRQNEFLLTDKQTGALTPRGEAILAHTPMKRFGTPHDLLGAALWLLSPASAFVTGAVVPVDGGFAAFSGV